jgi:hypothetical protein
VATQKLRLPRQWWRCSRSVSRTSSRSWSWWFRRRTDSWVSNRPHDYHGPLTNCNIHCDW